MKINDFFEMNICYTQEQVNSFATITGDTNPIHIDEDFASKSFFGSRIIHGFLSGSIFSRIIGTYFPGNGSIYLSQSMKFLKPMYTETNYTVRVIIVNCDYEKNRYTLKTTIHNKVSMEEALVGEALIYYKPI
ncbi:dehydrogenase [Ancylomarina euxinus]|uniref:Dehydrogenase n=1 Tax=Ancylomarina euxinus TaxID=2283627 RepID=A0A425XWR3_9BACT|nr:MaoC family dehydratase [Ancylomarina euxinus]MCZ4696341.1 MaoC family dehydratase [Ancylomarina euxinus]MUP16758.1 dehydrogenase [Ancylomarina euxinus]RRG19078.1 dehydrogenase [Ancylomarina euxinus]